jgi:hypothetical protein
MPEAKGTGRETATIWFVVLAILAWSARLWASSLSPSLESKILKASLDVIAFACHIELFQALEGYVERDLGSANSWSKFLHLPGGMAAMLLFRDVFTG